MGGALLAPRETFDSIRRWRGRASGGVAACALAANAVGADGASSRGVRGRVRGISGVRRAARAWECASSARAGATSSDKEKPTTLSAKNDSAVTDRESL